MKSKDVVIKNKKREENKLELIAFHLPQFHPIKENDDWWGVGFSEWRNVAKAKPIFPGHQQPKIPKDLGFYDLRLLSSIQKQIELSKEYGISGFCYYHYWFAGRKLLEQPIEILRDNNQVDCEYCLCWANHSWTGHWAGQPENILMEQTYPGADDDKNHYEYLKTFFKDPRYIKIDDRPVLLIFKPEHIPNVKDFCERMKLFSKENGGTGIYLIAQTGDEKYLEYGFDALAPHAFNDAMFDCLKGFEKIKQLIKHKIFRYPRWTIKYEKLIKYFKNREMDGIKKIPTVVPNWDNTPRVGRRGVVLTNSTPEKFYEHLVDSSSGLNMSSNKRKIMLIKSWNEWAEGNYLEPDLRHGNEWLQAIKKFKQQ